MNWEKLKDILLFWGLFMTSSMHAAIFLGEDCFDNLHSVRNTEKKPHVQTLFDVTQRLVHEENLEMSGVTESSRAKSAWERRTLADDDEAIKLMKAKVYVFSDSVLCV